jgi:ABC-type Fe3+ transport system substrate-binding protein
MNLVGPALLCLLTTFVSCSVDAEVLHDLPAAGQEATVLEVHAGADFAAIKPVLEAFQRRYPGIRLRYHEFGTLELYHAFLERYPQTPDLVMSSAMDLQVKLVNDGYARPYRSAETDRLPDWARWRNEIFGITYEPAVFVLNTGFLDNESVPASRAALIDLIRRKGDQVRGRIGTFDIERVGIGYLVWSHDNQRTASNGRLLELFATQEARLFTSSAAMLRALVRGDIVIAYNVLGSYAHAWAKRHPLLTVVLAEDYTTVIMRTAFVPKNASNPADARRFLDFLLSNEGQQLLADEASLYPVRGDIIGETGASRLRLTFNSPLRPIPLGVPLLVQTDEMKRALILEEWRRALDSPNRQ